MPRDKRGIHVVKGSLPFGSVVVGKGSFDSVAARFALGNSAQDDSVILGTSKGETNLDFQVNNETYFLDLSAETRQWLVFVETPMGTRRIPVYEDEPTSEDVRVIVEDKKRRQIVN